MRKFSSDGPVDTGLHYYAPRQRLIDTIVRHLVGDDPERDGHYVTVWGPKQCGKSWLLQQAMHSICTNQRYANFDVLTINLKHFNHDCHIERVIAWLTQTIVQKLTPTPVTAHTLVEFEAVFRKTDV